jgi:hypothetical protein
MNRLFLPIAFCVGCAAAKPDTRPRIPLTPPAELCGDPTLAPDRLCVPSARLEPLLKTGRLEILQVRNPSSGTAGAKALIVGLPDEKLVIKVKWKESKRGGEGINNTPRKELAAYQLQKLFLTPDEYVVPPAVGRCLPANPVDGSLEDKDETFKGVACVYGVLSYWLEHVTEEHVLDLPRFVRDEPYRASVSNMNLVTYLINHRDTRPSNFLIAKDPRSPRVFSIDNGLAFSGLRNPRQIFLREWNYIVVPSLPRAQIDKLRLLRRPDLDKLAVVAQYVVRGNELDEVPPTAPLAPDQGVRRAGEVIQLGLTKKEIDAIEKRLAELLEQVDKGKIALH